jgi:hypothetical protein
MSNGELMPLPVFWARNGLSKVQYYYLRRVGRGPATISIGSKELVAPESEVAWRQAMASNPLRGALKKLVEAAEAARAESSAA